LVANSVTSDDLERRNRPNGCVISPNSVAFWADCVIVGQDTRIAYGGRRRSDWNSGGTHGGTYYKSPAVDAKKYIFLHCNASNLVFEILQHDKIWGTIPRSKFWGYLSSRPPWSTPMYGEICPTVLARSRPVAGSTVLLVS